jgi:Holliday junction resolvasome RuvABC endonuclease subunit
MIISMGIDPSATRTGVAISHMKGDKLVVTHQASLTSEYKGLQRGAEMADDIGALVDRWKPNIVTLEGYAFGNKFSLATLVEVGTMIRGFSW